MAIADGFVEDSDDEALGPSLYNLVSREISKSSDQQPRTSILPDIGPQDSTESLPQSHAASNDSVSLEASATASETTAAPDAMEIDTEYTGGRRFRPRTAIQLHPYMYDQALYGQYFGKQRVQVPESSQDEDFEPPDSPPTVSQTQPEITQQPIAELEPDTLDLRRIMVVDSSDDSESDVEERTVVEDSKPARIRYGLPASVVDLTRDEPESQIVELLSESFGHDEDSDDSAGGLTQTRLLDSEEEDIPEAADSLDYMMAPRKNSRLGGKMSRIGKPTGQKRQQRLATAYIPDNKPQRRPRLGLEKGFRGRRSNTVSLDNVLKSLGRSALPAIKLAARTARRRGPGVVRPVNKYFVVEDGTRNYAAPVLSRWRKQAKSQSQGAPSTIVRPKAVRSYSGIGEMDSNQTIVQATKKKRKQRTYKYHPGDGIFHTTIVELPTNKFVPRHLPAKRSTSAPADPSLAITHIEAQRETEPHDKLASMPFGYGIKPLVPRKFSQDTFVGSNLLEMFSEFTEWNGNPGQSIGKRLVDSSHAETEETLHRIGLIVSGKVGEIDSSTFLLIYNWLLQSAADLISPSAIMSESTRSLIYQSIWPMLQVLKVTTLPHLARAQMSFIIYSIIALKQAVRFDPHTFGQLQRQVSSLANDLLAELVPAIVADFCNLSVISQGAQTLEAEAVALEVILITWNYGILKPGGAENVLWAFVFIQTASKRWAETARREIVLEPFGWPEVSDVVARSLKRGGSCGKQAMERCILLITRWQWPANADIINTFFNYFARQQNYADPEGEIVNLPAFLSLGRFDGTVLHPNEHHTFLELLGLTLRKFSEQNDIKQSRRIVGRVSPLSTLSFPENQRVSAVDLSRASQQYGILLVCMRFCLPEARPLVAQVADLLQLEKMHLALVLKAVSAWYILASFLESQRDLADCRDWLQLIFQSCYSRYLRFRAENIQTAAIKLLDKIFLDICERLIKLNDRSQFFPQLLLLLQCEVSEKTLRKLWQLSNWLTEDLSVLYAFYHSNSRSKHRFEIQSLGTILAVRKTPVSELRELRNAAWDLQLLASVIESSPCPEMYAEMVVETLPDVLTAFVWTDHALFLRSLAKFVPLAPISVNSDISARVSLVEAILNSVLVKDKLHFATQIMGSLRTHYELATRSNDLDYGSRQFVLKLRRAIVWQYPGLESSARWFHGDRGDVSADATHRAIFGAVGSTDEGLLLRFETFLAYRLAASLASNAGSSFVREITTALAVSGQSSWSAAHFVMETAFARYGRLSCSCSNQPISYAFLVSLDIAEALITTQPEAVVLPVKLIRTLCSYLTALAVKTTKFSRVQQEIFRASHFLVLALSRNLSLAGCTLSANHVEVRTVLDDLFVHFSDLYGLLIEQAPGDVQETRLFSDSEEDVAVMEALQDIEVKNEHTDDVKQVRDEILLLRPGVEAIFRHDPNPDQYGSLEQTIRQLSLADGYTAAFAM